MKTNRCIPFPSQSDFCPALAQFVEEHRFLQGQLDELLQLAFPLQMNSGLACPLDPVRALHHKVNAFYIAMSLHMQKEESYLLPLLAGYTDRGPLASLECEHEQIRFHLASFVNHTRNVDDCISALEAKSVTYHLTEAAAVISAHCQHEETELYPLAEQLLPDRDKTALLQRI